MNECEVFVQLVEIDDECERKAFLDRVCVDDQDLRLRIECLLAQHRREDRFFLDASPVAVDVSSDPTGAADIPMAIGTTFTSSPPLTVQPGTQIGSYTIQEQIGEGGFGVVYAAEQEQPIQRKVALKILKPGMNSREITARFEAERQVLSLMDHPHVARVLDAGTAPSGVPYFVMELVHGFPITDFCDKEKLSTVDRLRLFIDVCRAVQHAHQKGIIHRDIKPSNVLVTIQNGRPVAKVIDFGIAKALNQGLTGQTVHTVLGQLVGTPIYMSPEQADPSGMDVDTRSDVYSLGVLLYELLTGTTPFDADTLRKAGIPGLRRILCETEPPRPSARVSSLNHQQRSTISGNRQLDSRRMAVTLRGDLDWIVMKALEKDRNRRYGSPAEFADDIERYLTGLPVEAGPPSPWYRSKKFILRHQLWLTTGALVLLAMISGTGVSVWHAIEADAARKQAQQAEDLANERLELLQLEQKKLQEEQQKLQQEKQKLAVSQAQSDRNFNMAKQAVAKLIDEVAQKRLIQYPELGEFRTTLLETAEEFYTDLLQESPGSFDILQSRAEIRRKLNRPDEALEDYLAADELQPDSLPLLLRLSDYFRTNGAPRSENAIRALEKAQRAVELYPDDAGAWHLLAWAYFWTKDQPRAVEVMKRAVEFTQGETYKAHRLGNLYQFENRYAEAASEYLKAAEGGNWNPAEDYFRAGLCMSYLDQYEEAIEYLNKSIELDSYRYLSLNQRGEAYLHLGELDKAAADFQRALSLSPATSYILESLFNCYMKQNDASAAAELLNSRTGGFNADQKLLKEKQLTWIERTSHQPLVEARDKFLERIESHKLKDVSYRARKHHQRAVELRDHGRIEDCLQVLRETNEEESAFADNYILLGIVLRAWPHSDRGNESAEREAIAAYRKALECAPSSYAAHDQLSRALTTTPILELRDPQAAVDHAENCLQNLPQQNEAARIYALATLGMAQYRVGDFEAAQKTLEQVRAESPKHFVYVDLFLAMTSWQLGDREQAGRWFDEAMSNRGTVPGDIVDNVALAEARALLSEILEPGRETAPAESSQASGELSNLP